MIIDSWDQKSAPSTLRSDPGAPVELYIVQTLTQLLFLIINLQTEEYTTYSCIISLLHLNLKERIGNPMIMTGYC